MQLQQKLQLSVGREVVLELDDIERMRRAFAGIHIDPRRRHFYRLHLEAGQATLNDGLRLHTIPIKFQSHFGVEVDWEEVQQITTRGQAVQTLVNSNDDGLWQWQEVIPKADLGVLCDIDQWLPVLTQIRGWGWSSFTFNRHDTVIQPMSATTPDMLQRVAHLMYKGKNVPRVEERVFNPQYIYDVFRNARALGDSRVFLCVVSQNLIAPLLCRGNNSAMLALVRAKK